MGISAEDEHLLSTGPLSTPPAPSSYSFCPKDTKRTTPALGGSRSFVVKRFQGTPDASRGLGLLFCLLCCVIVLFVITFGLFLFCLLPIVVVILLCNNRSYEETITFNNDTCELQSQSFPSVRYEGVRIQAQFVPKSSSVVVHIFMDALEPAPVHQGFWSFFMLPPTSKDPKFEVPLVDLDVFALRETMHQISSFSGIASSEPSLPWEQIQVIVSNMASMSRHHHHHGGH